MLSRRLLKKTEELLAQEKGTVFKNPGGKVNICLCYPNTYHVGMSNLAVQGLYGLLNEREDVVCERAFLPEEDDLQEHIRTGTPLFSLESRRPLREFHIVAFSVSFENDYPNILKMLELSRIPPRNRDRTEREPLLLLGGVCATFNPEPLAEFFDVVFIGEAEDVVYRIIDLYASAKDKKDFLKSVVSVRGCYVPGFYRVFYSKDGTISHREVLFRDAPETVEKVTAERLDGRIRHSITTPNTEFSDMCLVEAMRGCPWNCRFCLTGYIYRPVRQKPLSLVQFERQEGKKVGLIGPSLSEYRFIQDVLSDEIEMSITSIRASKASLEVLKHIKQKTLSIAPETGSERLRRAINKRITTEEILYIAEEAFRAGISTLRLYFMVGLPAETEEDIQATVELIRKIRAVSDRGSVVVSISPFVPKPFTPLQWAPMETQDVVKKRLGLIKKALTGLRGVRVFHDVLKYVYLQGLFARGDRRLSEFLLRLDRPSRWRQCLKEAGLNEWFYLFRERSFQEHLPWDFINTGVSKEYLWQQYRMALKEASVEV